MTLQRRAIGYRSSLMSLAVMALWTSQAQATVDFGRTIDAVKMDTVSATTQNSPYSITTITTTTATLVSRASVVDAQTGLQWIKASTLAEGEALGYRAATSSEFQSFIAHTGWEPMAGAPEAFALTRGFNYQESRTTTSSSMGSPSSSYSSTTYTSGLAPVSFSPDVSVLGSSAYGSSTIQKASVAWLDGVAGGSVGAMFTTMRNYYLPSCSGGRSVSCSTSVSYSNEVAMGAMSDLQSGAYDSATHATGGNWSALMAQLPQIDGGPRLMYYMVASVPEPSSYALMGLGLIGVATAARRRQRRA